MKVFDARLGLLCRVSPFDCEVRPACSRSARLYFVSKEAANMIPKPGTAIVVILQSLKQDKAVYGSTCYT